MPFRFASVRSEPRSTVPVRSLPFKMTLVRFALVKSAPVNVVPIRTEFDRSASTSIAFDRLPSMMTLFDKSSPVRFLSDISKISVLS